MPKNDVEIAFDGGPDFMTRLQSLATTKDNAQKALEALNLGHDAVAALASAKEQLRSASETKVEADKYAATTRADADAYAAKVRADADAVLAAAESTRQGAIAVEKETKTHRDTLASATVEAKQTQAIAEQTVSEYTCKQQELDAKTAKFKTAMLELKRDLGSDGDKLLVPPFTQGELQALEQVQ